MDRRELCLITACNCNAGQGITQLLARSAVASWRGNFDLVFMIRLFAACRPLPSLCRSPGSPIAHAGRKATYAIPLWSASSSCSTFCRFYVWIRKVHFVSSVPSFPLASCLSLNIFDQRGSSLIKEISGMSVLTRSVQWVVYLFYLLQW